MRRAIAITALFMAAAMITAASPPTPDTGTPPAATEAEVNRIQQFRETAGFPASRSFVERSLTDPSFSDVDFGVPLTAAEVSEVQRRIDLQEAVDPVFIHFDSLDGSAGTFMDQPAGGIPTFVTTRDATEMREILAGVMPAGVEFRVVRVEFSRDDLEMVKRQINSDRLLLRDFGVDVRSAALSIRSNSVLVGVRDLDDGGRALLRARYGSIIATREEPTRQLDHSAYPHDCESRVTCPPLKGGIKIYRTSNTSAICTAGFIVKLQGTSTLRVLTAGHCIELNGGLGVGWSHHGTQFGTAQTETWGSGSNADAGLISVAVAGNDNLFYASDFDDIRGVTGTQPYAEQDEGDYVCRGAKTTGYMCGYIENEDVDRDVDGKLIEHQWEVDFDASPGDSGAPYFIGYEAYGIHSDSTDSGPARSWYSPMGWVFSKLSSYGEPITLCTAATC